MRIGCILLAAGSGRRFGGDKLLYEVNGQTMIERAAALHEALPYAARVAVVRPGDRQVAECAAAHGFTVAVNARALQGIGTSASLGMRRLQALDGALDGAVFAVSDQPNLTEQTVMRLSACFSEHPERIVAPSFEGRRGNPVIFPRALFAAFAALDADEGGSVVIREHPDRLLLCPVANGAELADIDTKGVVDACGRS